MQDNLQNEQAFTVRKKVDESWKDTVQKEKEINRGEARTAEPKRPSAAAPESNFAFFVSSLGMQALAALGEVRVPGQVAAEPDLRQARYLIDVIEMLVEKTRGNLTPEEENMLKELLYELHMAFVRRTEAGEPKA